MAGSEAPWIVAGQGIAAVAAALRLAEAPAPGEVFLIAAGPAPGASRLVGPALLAGDLDARDLAAIASRRLAGSRVRWLKADPADADQIAGRLTIRTRDGEESLPFSRLLRVSDRLPPQPPAIPGLDLPGVFPLRCLSDCVVLSAHLSRERPRRGVVVGASGVALAVTSALSRRSIHLTLFDGGEPLLPDLDPAIARAVLPELRAAGVPFYTGAPLTALEPGRRGHRQGRLRRIGSNRTSIVADFVAIVGDLTPPPPFRRGEGEIPPGLSEPGQEAWGLALAEMALAGSDVSEMQADRGVVAYQAFGLELARTAPPPPGVPAERVTLDAVDRSPGGGVARRTRLILWSDQGTGRLLAAQVAGRDGAAARARLLALAIAAGLTLEDLPGLDLDLVPTAGRSRLTFARAHVGDQKGDRGSRTGVATGDR